MYRTILVEDEPLVRIALREIIDWQKYECEIIGEFSNGKEALSFIRKSSVDLLITDIEMPTLNGIDLLRELRELPVAPLSIVLSAYSHYDYVREAFLQGAHDYIVKEDIGADYVGGIVEKAVRKLKVQHGEQARKEREQEAKLAENYRNGLRGVMLRNDVMHEFQPATRDHVLVCLLVDRGRDAEFLSLDESQRRFLQRTAQQALDAHGVKGQLVELGEYEYAAALALPDSSSRHGFRSLLQNTLLQAVSHIDQYMNVSVSIGVSEYAHERTLWYGRYQQARTLAGLRFSLGYGRLHFPEDHIVLANIPEDRGAALGSDKWLPLLERGESGWEEQLDASIRALEQDVVPADRLMPAYRAVLHEVGSLLHAKGLNWSAVAGSDTSVPHEYLERLETRSAVHAWLKELIRKVAERIDPRNRSADQSMRPVDAAKAYIDRHYAEPITLSLVSQYAGVSETYLSKLFAKETGETFVEYLTRKRVEKAVGWMDSDLKIYEIAERVGYPDQGHFTKVFKRVTGLSPLEYRVQNPPKKE